MRVLIYSPVRLFGDCMAAFLLTAESVEAVLVEHKVLDLDLKAVEFGADVALFDVTGAEAMQASRLVKSLDPDISTVAVAVTEVVDDVLACAESGFDAYVPRTARTSEMLEIVLRAQLGETVCDPKIAYSLFHELARRRASAEGFGGDHLTPREMEIARMLSRGAANKEIAAQLNVSLATVKNHVHSVLHKLQINSRSQVATLLSDNPMVLRQRNSS